MKKMINNVHLEGWLYEHNLELKTSGATSKNPGTEYITGTVSIATDPEMTTIVPIHYTYITATTKNKAANPQFITLKGILDGTIKTAMGSSKETATKVVADSTLELNEFYSTRTGKEELVSVKRNEGGFIHISSEWNERVSERNKFTVDMLITKARMLEPDTDKNIPERMMISGVIFNFRNEIMPVEFVVYNPDAFTYFGQQNISSTNPFFTKVWGTEVSTVVVKKIIEESAFGEDSVREVKNVTKEFVVTSAATDPYEWNTEETLTSDDIIKAQQNREIKLAQLKERANKPATPVAPAATASANAIPVFKF